MPEVDPQFYRAAQPPPLESFAAELYRKLAPLTWDDVNQNWALAYYMGSLGAMFQVIQGYARDQNGAVGWSQMVDVERCPDEALPWLGQFVGVVAPPQGANETNEAYAERLRVIVRNQEAQARGSVGAMKSAIAAVLTGNKFVDFTERDTSPYHFHVNTLTYETPDAAALTAAINAAKPAGLQYTYTGITGQTFNIVKGKHATFDAVKAAYANFDAMKNAAP